MDKLCRRIERKPHSNEILDRYLCLSITRSNVNQQTLYLALQYEVQFVANKSVMFAYDEAFPVIQVLEEKPGKIQRVAE